MKKITSSTLLEVIVGLVIITLSYGILFRLIVNVNKSENVMIKTNTLLLVNEIIEETKTNLNFTDESYDFGYLLIEKKITAYEDNDKLKILHINAYNRENKIVFEKKEIISVVE